MPAPSTFLGERHVRVRAAMQELGLDALVVTHAPNILYLANHSGGAGVLVLTSKEIFLLADFRYAEGVNWVQASSRACPGLVVRDVPGSYDEAVVTVLTDLGRARVGIEAAHLSVARFEWWRTTIAGRSLPIDLVPTERVVERFRAVKDPWELDALRAAAARLTAVAETAVNASRAGATEREVAGAIEAALRSAGFDRPAFETIVASGPHSALPHHRAGDRQLRTGDLVVLDFGGFLDGYCCDLTRTVALGPPTPEIRRVYDAVREAQQAALIAVRPGASATDVDAAARAVLDARDLGHAFGHGTGHGLGLEVHEDPRVGRPRPAEAATVLEPGMVLTIEPGAYLAGRGGVRIEDDVLVTPTGCELLTSFTRDLLIR